MGMRASVRHRTTYGATFYTRSWSDLCPRFEDAVPARYGGDQGFEIRVQKNPNTFTIQAHRGLTSGFTVCLFADPEPAGETRVILGVARSSRLDHWGLYIAVLFGVFSSLAVCGFIGAAGLRPPDVVWAVIFLGITAALSFIVYLGLLPAIVLLEYLGGGRLTDDQMAAVAEMTRSVVDNTPSVARAPEESRTSR